MDTMTYLSLKALGLPKNRIIGMGGALDSSRFKYFFSQALGCNANEVEGMVILSRAFCDASKLREDEIFDRVNAVSYTHLDVYKRQDRGKSQNRRGGG